MVFGLYSLSGCNSWGHQQFVVKETEYARQWSLIQSHWMSVQYGRVKNMYCASRNKINMNSKSKFQNLIVYVKAEFSENMSYCQILFHSLCAYIHCSFRCRWFRVRYIVKRTCQLNRKPCKLRHYQIPEGHIACDLQIN